MNEAAMFIKQAVLFLILLLAIFIPVRISFTRNYFVLYVIAVIAFCLLYSVMFFGLRVRSVNDALNDVLSGAYSLRIGSFQLNRSLESIEDKRLELIENFKDLKLSKEDLLEKIGPLNDQIIQGYADNAYRKIKAEIRFLSSRDESVTVQSSGPNNDFIDNFKLDPKSLVNLDGIDETIRELKVKDLYSDEIRSEVERLKKYILNTQILDP